MKHYLAIDSGGTKVLAILYDEEFRPVKSYRTGSMRGNTTSPELMRRNISALIDELGLAGTELELVSGITEGELLDRMRASGTRMKRISGCGELEAGLAAAEIFGDAMLALAGTGASLFGQYEGRGYSAGGYGASVADEGSGYWVARAAFGAAIKDDEGRGPRTMLTELIAEQLGRPGDLREAIFRIYSQSAMSPVACVASCAPLVSMAAEAGDAVALGILRNAGRVLAEQLLSLVRRYGLPKDLPVTISGSVWRSHPVLFREFCGILRDAGMERDVTVPAFEPIVGVIIRHYREVHGTFGDADRARFMELYKDFTFSVSK